METHASTLWLGLVFLIGILGYRPRGIIVVAGLTCVFAAAVAWQRRDLRVPWDVWVALVLLGLGILSAGRVVDRADYIEAMLRLGWVAVFALAGHNYLILSDIERPRQAWAASARIFGLVMLIHVLVSSPEVLDFLVAGKRVDGLYRNENHFGVACALAVLLLLPRWTMPVANWFAHGGTLALLLLGVIISGSRQALIGVVVGVLAYQLIKGVTAPSLHLAAKCAVVGLLVLVLASTAIYNIDFLNNRFGNMVHALSGNTDAVVKEKSVVNRLDFYRIGYEMWRDHPWFGVGPKQFGAHSAAYGSAQPGTYSHSNYIEILTNYGIFGFIVYFAWYASIAVGLFRARRQVAALGEVDLWGACVAVFAFIIVTDLMRVSYYGPVERLALVLVTSQLLAFRLRFGRQFGAHARET